MLPNDAYIWQFAWTPPLSASVIANADTIRAWRVLVDETSPRQPVHLAAPDWRILAASAKPVILVHRIDGRAETLEVTRILALTANAETAAQSAGVSVTGVEIDFDCATARLADYAIFLRALRQGLPAGLSLSITALPTWLHAPALREVRQAVDETVLQVHAIADPKTGLFDPAQAAAWTQDWAAQSPRPFRVALPSYGVRVEWEADGRIAAVAGEAPQWASGDNSAELAADPAILANFVQKLASRPPATLAGLVWFRLPSGEDQRNWSPETWRAVLSGTAQFAAPTASLRLGDRPGLYEVVLSNPGEIDVRLPAKLSLVGCTSGDGANGYDFSPEKNNFILLRHEDGLLTGKSSRIIGWTRCPLPNALFDVQP